MPMATRDELLREAETEYAGLTDALAGLHDGEMTRPWLGSWGVREIVAHMIGWHREMVPALERLGRGEPPHAAGAYDDYDGWNARFVEARRGLTADALLRELDASHGELITVASRLPAELSADGGPAAGVLA